MFGYILPEKPELKIKEYEMFRAYYCGVCKSIGNRYGQIPRLTLNYDSTFLAVLLSAVHDEDVQARRERCIAHPFKKRNVVIGNTIIDYASDMNIVLAYYNLEDNWKDEKSVLSAAGAAVLKSAFKKIQRQHKIKCGIIKKRLEELSKLEEGKCASMDEAAEPFAKLMEEITAFEGVSDTDKTEKILRWIGYNIGKWIYILDAYDDIEKDIEKGAYNPLLYQFKYENEKISEFKLKIKEKVEFNLTYALGQIAKSYELIETKSNSGLVENIIYMGMLRKTEQILGVGSCRKIEKSI